MTLRTTTFIVVGLTFAIDRFDEFEKRFIAQADHEDRTIVQTLTIGWELFSSLPKADLKKIDEKYIEKYLPKK